nr:MAG TPA: hypothetical protein [Caudoviricetes sp.]
MIGIKHDDKNKILDYCIRKCVENHDALLGIRTSIIREKSEQMNVIDNSIIFTGLLYYPISDDDDVILSDYELQINDSLVVFYMHFIILNKNNEWSNAIIRTAQLDYDIAVLSRNMGYTQHNKLITIS